MNVWAPLAVFDTSITESQRNLRLHNDKFLDYRIMADSISKLYHL